MEAVALLLLLLLTSLAGAQDWRTAADLPGADWTGLPPRQKQAALQALREFDCTCGCGMKTAQCRIEDPPCAQSRELAAMAIEAAKQGKSEGAILDSLAGSPLARQARERNRILLDPVAIPIDGSPSKGPAGARITLVEFSDFQCPFCAAAVAKLNAVLKAYPNDVRLVFKQFPLDSHSKARFAAAAALAAHAQGKFWPLHDRMYAEFRRLTRENILAWAKELGLDAEKLAADAGAASTAAAVERDYADGEKAGVDATPTVFVNGKKYQGTLDLAAIGPVIEAELRQMAATSPAARAAAPPDAARLPR
jgi:protein-disulfide isomerase